MHDAVVSYCRRWATDLPGRGLDVGGREVSTGQGHRARALWPNVTWDVIDTEDGPGVTVVGDARFWNSAPVRYDVILCTEVLEHVEDWRDIVTNARDNLAPGGRLVVTCAGPLRLPHSAIIEGPLQPGEYYQNVAPDELREALEAAGLERVRVEQVGADTRGSAVKPRSPSRSGPHISHAQQLHRKEDPMTASDDRIDAVIEAFLDHLDGSGEMPTLDHLDPQERARAEELIAGLKSGRGIDPYASRPSLEHLLAGTPLESALQQAEPAVQASVDLLDEVRDQLTLYTPGASW